MSDAKQAVLRAVENVEHGSLEGVAEDDLVVVVVTARDDLAVPLDLQRPVLGPSARVLDREILETRAIVSAVPEVVRLPDLDRVRPRLPERAERVGIGLVLRKHQIVHLEPGLLRPLGLSQIEEAEEVGHRHAEIELPHHDVVRLRPHSVEAHPHLVEAGVDETAGAFLGEE